MHGVLDAQGKLHTVLWLERNEYRVAYLTQENAVWTMTQLADGIYPDIAIDEAGTLFIAYVDSFLEDGAPDGSFDSNSVLLISSSDGGATWSEPVLVSRSGKLQAHVPRILVAPEGRLHLLWEKDVDTQNILPEIIWHAYSDDGGASWSDPVEIQESTGMLIFGFDAVVDHFGRVHVIFTGTRSFDAPESHLYQSVWSCGAWSRPSQVFDRNNVNHQPLVAMDDSNRLYVVWTEHAPYAQPDSYNNWDKAYHTRREARAEGCWETVNSTS